ncbi:hypothetical protein EYF80_046170 [Liparis tanakae]|uniref:Uncharacterized protein n=1 Tax=Liparis tanakae TaxID=230148 RepID=A0A4Z2FQV8_9TELE|nr:hypothetical protein EYF80_046170 [Liparis tanakae]
MRYKPFSDSTSLLVKRNCTIREFLKSCMMSFCGHWSVFLWGDTTAAVNRVHGKKHRRSARLRSDPPPHSQVFPLVHVHLTRQRAR